MQIIEVRESNMEEELNFKQEKKTLIVTLTVFTLNVGVLFAWCELNPVIFESNFFLYIIMGEVLAIFDIATMLCLLVFHFRNF